MSKIPKDVLEVARVLENYIKQYCQYQNAYDDWVKRRTKHAAVEQRYASDLARYQRDLQKWNADRSAGIPVSGQPRDPGPGPAPFTLAIPVRPVTPANLHHQIYNNSNHYLPRAQKGFSYHEAQVGTDRDGGRGKRRIVVLADDSSGAVNKKYYTDDHYGDAAKAHKASFSVFS